MAIWKVEDAPDPTRRKTEEAKLEYDKKLKEHIDTNLSDQCKHDAQQTNWVPIGMKFYQRSSPIIGRVQLSVEFSHQTTIPQTKWSSDVQSGCKCGAVQRGFKFDFSAPDLPTRKSCHPQSWVFTVLVGRLSKSKPVHLWNIFYSEATYSLNPTNHSSSPWIFDNTAPLVPVALSMRYNKLIEPSPNFQPGTPWKEDGP